MKSAWCLALACLIATRCAISQELGRVTDAAPKVVPTASFEFSKPQAIANVGADAMLAGRFDCGSNGSVYALVQGKVSGSNADPERQDGVALLGVHPDAAITSFPWWSVSGFAEISIPRSVFVGNGHVYLLVTAKRDSEQQEHIGRSFLILKFDTNGNLQDTLALDPNLTPWAFGVFPSGDILVVSEDRLNHRMALNLFDEHGGFIRELRLNKDDFIERAAQLPPSSRGTSAYASGFLVSLSKLIPWNGHLLLVPLLTSGLPIVELGEDGVISAVTPRLPDKAVIESIISSSDSAFTVQLATIVESANQPVDFQGKLHSVGLHPIEQLTEISRANGDILRQIDLGSSGVEPACESGGVYRFLLSNNQRELQIVAAKVR